MRDFTVKVRTATGDEKLVSVRATGSHDAARKALWYILPGAEVVWVNADRPNALSGVRNAR